MINLKRRPDRLEQAKEELKNWCFKEPEIFEAIDGNKVPTPIGWEQGGGAWGCMQSHRHILEKAIMDDTKSLMVLEDDFILCENFEKEIKKFLAEVPSDWEQLMIGGQHISTPKRVKPGIVQCVNCQRTHAYAIRGNFLKKLYSKWHSSHAKVHCDWIMGPLQVNYKVYAPDPFLIGQRTSQSDISGRINPTKFWIPPSGKECLVLLNCNKDLLTELIKKGIHIGYSRNEENIDIGVAEAFKNKKPNIARLTEWVYDVMWEVKSNSNLLVAACWHPLVTLDMLKLCWSGPIFEIKGTTVDEILNKIEIKIKHSNRIFI